MGREMRSIEEEAEADDGQNFRDGHHVNSSSSGSRTSPQLLENEITLKTAFDSDSKITMTGLGDELNSRKRRRTSEQQEGEEEGKEATSRLLLLGGIQRYGKENMDTLSIKMLLEYIHDKVLPALVHLTINEPVEEEEEQSVSIALDLDSEEYKSKLKQILIIHGLTCIVSPSTIYCWMTCLGFRYGPRKKGYYVDGHEKPATIQYQWEH
jgi:hypothetical protein